jgi:predicted nuclease of predicted toxin-antitoxin system
LKLLFDDNLSWRLERLLDEAYPDCKHVRSINELPIPASDLEIWEFALINDYIIVTNDDDFSKLAVVNQRCPKIIIFRVGNKKTSEIAEILRTKKDEIDIFYRNKEHILFEIR